MPEMNPYASPAIVAEQPPAQSSAGGVWRRGNLLVMERHAVLPDRCIKSNLPAEGRTLRRDVSHYPPLLVLLAVANMLIFLIVVLMVQKRATIYIGLCERWANRRRRVVAASWLLVGFSVMLGAVGVSLLDYSPYSGLLIGGAIVLGFAGGIYGIVAARLVHAARITDTHIWIRGVCPEYLDALPICPFD